MPKRTNTDANIRAATGTGDVPPLDDKSQQILAALAELGEATAAGLATHLGIGYSTTTPKLRKLNEHGLAQSGKADNGQSVWRLTDAGNAHPAATGSENGATDHDTSSTDPASAAAGSDTKAQDAAATTDPADDTDSRPDSNVTTSVSSAPVDAVEEPAVEDDAADGGATAADGAVYADGLVTAAATDLPAAGSDNGEATADTAAETPVADSGDGGDDPAGENGDDTADETSAEVTDDDATEGIGPVPGPGHDATSGADDAAASAAAPTGGGPAAAKVRRPSGSLDKAVLTILQARPDLVFKVGELSKLINNMEQGTGMSPASPGAVVLAAQRLVARQQAVLAVEKPASFQLRPDTAATAAQPDTAESQTGTPSETQAEAVDAVTLG